MAKFSDHVEQARKNLVFLGQISKHCNKNHDWHVTVAFYVSVHLVNAYLVKEIGINYNSHTETFNAINFANQMSPYRFSEENYLAYRKLYNLSRRSRYLCIDADDKSKGDPSTAYLTHSVHEERAVKHLEKLLNFISTKYGETFPCTILDLVGINNTGLRYFKHQVS